MVTRHCLKNHLLCPVVAIAVFILLPWCSAAQGIRGQLLDEKKEPLVSAVVHVFLNGTVQGANVTDYDGNFIIKPLSPGRYSLIAHYQGYDTLAAEVLVTPDSLTVFNGTFKKKWRMITYVPNCNIGRLRNYFVYGKVKNRLGRNLSGANVVLYKDGKPYDSVRSDKHGNYGLRCTEIRLVHAIYELRAFYPRRDSAVIDINFSESILKQNIVLKRSRRKVERKI